MGKRRYREIEEDEEDYRPRRRHGGDSRAPLIITLVCLVVGVVGGGGFLVYWLVAGRPKAQLRKKEEKRQERLVGRWSALTDVNPRTVTVFDFRTDGTFSITVTKRLPLRSATLNGIWKVVETKGNTVRVHTERNGKPDNDMFFEFISADRFQFTNEGRVHTFDRVR